MKILKFKRYNVVEQIIEALEEEEDDELVEAIVIGKRKSGTHFSFMTNTDNILELIGCLEAIKNDLVWELISNTESDD